MYVVRQRVGNSRACGHYENMEGSRDIAPLILNQPPFLRRKKPL